MRPFFSKNTPGIPQSRIISYNLRYKHYNQKAEESFSLQAKRGDWDQSKDKILLAGNVRYEESKRQRQVYTEQMEYDKEQALLLGTRPVRIYQKGLHSLCQKGIIIRLASQRHRCYAPQLHLLRGKALDFKELFDAK